MLWAEMKGEVRKIGFRFLLLACDIQFVRRSVLSTANVVKGRTCHFLFHTRSRCTCTVYSIKYHDDSKYSGYARCLIRI